MKHALALLVVVLNIVASSAAAQGLERCNETQSGYFQFSSSPPPSSDFERFTMLQLPYSRDRLVTVHVAERSPTGHGTVFVEFLRSNPSQTGAFEQFERWEPLPVTFPGRPSSFTTEAAIIRVALRKGFGVDIRGCVFVLD